MERTRFKEQDVFAATGAAEFRDEALIAQSLKEHKVTNLKIEAIAKDGYIKDGLNTVIFSREIKGEKSYIVGAYGRNEWQDYRDVGNAAVGVVPAQTQDFIRFLDDFRKARDITRPFNMGSSFSLGTVTMITASASRPDLFENHIFIDGPGANKQVLAILGTQEAVAQFTKNKKIEIWNGLPNMVNTHSKHLPDATMKFIPPIGNLLKIIGSEVSVEDYLRSPWPLHQFAEHVAGFRKNGLVNIDGEYYTDFSSAYTTMVNPNDLTKKWVIFKGDGKVYGKADTGAVGVGEHYVYRGRSKEEVADLFSLPMENIIGGAADILDKFITYTIIPEHKRIATVEEHKVKLGDNLWTLADKAGINIDELIRIEGNEALRARYEAALDKSDVRIFIGEDIKVPGTTIKVKIDKSGSIITEILDKMKERVTASDHDAEAFVKEVVFDMWKELYNDVLPTKKIEILEFVIEVTSGFQSKYKKEQGLYPTSSNIKNTIYAGIKQGTKALVQVGATYVTYVAVGEAIVAVIGIVAGAEIVIACTVAVGAAALAYAVSKAVSPRVGKLIAKTAEPLIDKGVDWIRAQVDEAWEFAQEKYLSFGGHEVKKGDSLWKIAQDNGLSLKELLNLPGNEVFKARYKDLGNGQSHVQLLKGETVKLPWYAAVASPSVRGAISGLLLELSKSPPIPGFPIEPLLRLGINKAFQYVHSVKKGDSLLKIARDNGISLKELLDANGNEDLKARYHKPGNKHRGRILIGEKITIPRKTQRVLTTLSNVLAPVRDVLLGQLQAQEQLRHARVAQVEKTVKAAVELGEKVWHETVGASNKAAKAIRTEIRDLSNAFEGYSKKTTGALSRAMSELGPTALGVGAGLVGGIPFSVAVPIAKSLLRIVSSDFSKAHNSKDMSNTYLNGLAKHSANYEIYMPASVLNGDGLTNYAPSSFITDSWRPGASALSRVNFKKDMAKVSTAQPKKSFVNTVVNTAKEFVRDTSHTLLQGINNVKRWSTKYLNIDPIVINLDGLGVRFISLAESEVLFDVDNDGFLESTCWVRKGSAFLVVDKNNNNRTDDITEMISEYYFSSSALKLSPAPLNNRKMLNNDLKHNPFEVLEFFDFSSDDGKSLDAKDDIFHSLRLWHDVNEDGLSSPNEMHLLSEYNITSISLRYKVAELGASHQIKYTSLSFTSDGRNLTTYAIGFDAKAEGDVLQSTKLGKITRSETGFSSLKLSASLCRPVYLSKYSVQNLYGSDDDDVIHGDKNDNWIFGGRGNDAIFAGPGDDVLVIDAEDDLEFIDGGDGYDIIYATGDQGVRIIMYPINVEQVYGTNGTDFIAVGNQGNSTTSGFIDGGNGDDLLIGDDASDAIAGGDGDDYIKGMGENDLLRGDRGNDIIEGGDGDDILEGGSGDDILIGGDGSDTLKGERGNDKLHGGEGIDYAEFNGNFEEYKLEKVNDNSYIVRDSHLNRDGVDELFYVEKLVFSTFGGSTYTVTLQNLFQSYEDFIPLKSEGPTIIDTQELLKNDINFSAQAIYVCGAQDAQGGSIELTKAGDKVTQITFKPDPKSFQIRQFGYTICTPGFTKSLELVDSKESATHYTRVCLTESWHPSDSLFYKQWYLNYINVIQVWRHYSGKGVHVLVNEGDADYRHKDLQNNLKTYDSSVTENFNVHATTVAGVVAASRNNFGLVGIAYSSTIGSESDILESHKKYDVINRSWKWAEEKPFLYGNRTEATYGYFAREGRGSLGTILVQSAGNNRESGDNTNDYKSTNSPYPIVVGALYKDASLSYGETKVGAFSDRGASVLISAPGSYIITSSTFTENDNGNIFTWDYSTVKGTSFSAPIVSGVIALMLEANPNLGYRDVQKILASTARIIDAGSSEWLYNADASVNFRGRHYNHDYGFGCVDAQHAVKAAEFWPYLGIHENKQEVHKVTKTGFKAIDSGDKIFGEILVKETFIVQDATLEYEINHKNFSNITLELFSPSGTRSILKEDGGNNSTSATVKFRALSKHFLGEESQGTWRYAIGNNHSLQMGFLKAANLTLSGDLVQPKLYMVTKELTTAQKFNDTDKDAILFMPSLEENLSLDLGPNKNFKILGVDFTTNEAVINKVVAGTGDDIILGNSNDNIIYGNDGSDVLSGFSGNDILVGNRGNDTLTGGPGADIFVLHYEAGARDVVTDCSDEDFVVFVKFKSYGATVNQDAKGTELALLNSQLIKFDHYNITLSAPNVIFVDDFQYYGSFVASASGGYHRTKTSMNQIIIGNSGSDVLHGSEGRDLLVGGDGDDSLNGYGGPDLIFGGKGNDIIFGYDGNDKLSGGPGKNYLAGGKGQDIFVFETIQRGFTDTIYDFNATEDKLDFSMTGLYFSSLKKDYMGRCPSDYDDPCIGNDRWQVVLVGVEINKLTTNAFIF